MAKQRVVEQNPQPPTADNHLPQGEIVPRETQYQRWEVDLRTPFAALPTNINLTTKHGRALAQAATQIADYQLDQQGRCMLRVTHWLLYPDIIENEQTGELDEVVWLVLFDKDGKTFKTTGYAGRQAIRAAAELFSAYEWAEGIPFIITSRLNSNKRICHDIRIVLDHEDVEGPPSDPR